MCPLSVVMKRTTFSKSVYYSKNKKSLAKIIRLWKRPSFEQSLFPGLATPADCSSLVRQGGPEVWQLQNIGGVNLEKVVYLPALGSKIRMWTVFVTLVPKSLQTIMLMLIQSWALTENTALKSTSKTMNSLGRAWMVVRWKWCRISTDLSRLQHCLEQIEWIK